MLGLTRVVEPQPLIPRQMVAAYAHARPDRRPHLRKGISRDAREGTLPPRSASEADRTMFRRGPAANGGGDRIDIGRGESPGTRRRSLTCKGRGQDHALADLPEQNRRNAQLIRNLRRVLEETRSLAGRGMDPTRRGAADCGDRGACCGTTPIAKAPTPRSAVQPVFA
jgi:hypothetical protein